VIARRIDEVFDDDGTRQRRNERIAMHVERVGPQCGQAVVLRVLGTDVEDDGFDRAAVKCALTNDIEVFPALADVRGDGHYLSVVLGGDPANSDGRVESP
jgi:hypothetical protein